jgi:hypothetical protein
MPLRLSRPLWYFLAGLRAALRPEFLAAEESAVQPSRPDTPIGEDGVEEALNPAAVDCRPQRIGCLVDGFDERVPRDWRTGIAQRC